MELFKLFGTIAINNQEANQSIDDTTTKAEDSGGRVSNAFKTIGTAVATYLSVSKIVDFGKQCVTMASDVEEMQNKFDVVFNEMGDDVSSWADDYAKSIGRNSNTIKGYLADNQNMFVGMGMTREAGADLSEQMVQLALDLASFNNLEEDQAVDSLSKAIMGQSESAKSLGAVLNDNTRSLAMQELGYEGTYDKLTEAQKMEVNYQAILMQSQDAIGDCARSLDSYKGRTIQLQSAKEKLYETIGQMLLPTLTQLASAMTTMVGGIQTAVDWFKEHENVAIALGIAFGTITTAVIAYNIAINASTIATTIATTATTAWGAVMAFVTSPVTLVVLAIGGLIAVIVLLVKNWDTVKEKTLEVWNKIKEKIDEIIDKIHDKFDSFKEKIQTVLDKVNDIKEGIVSRFTSVKDTISSTVDNIKTKVTGVFNSIQSTVGYIWDGIKSKITNPIQTAKDTIGGIIDTIKGWFDNFNISLPSIKLPHFSISPSGWTVGQLLEGVIPTLGISWYAKGGIMDGNTLFGLNGNQLMIGGENGKEAIIPLEKDTAGIELIASKLSENMNQGDSVVLQDKLNTIIRLLEMLTGMKIVLDSGELVGRIAPMMNSALGDIASANGRGGRQWA